MTATRTANRKPQPLRLSEFSVRETLAGRKTETRRLINPQPQQVRKTFMGHDIEFWAWGKGEGCLHSLDEERGADFWQIVAESGPYGKAGDLLYMSEPVKILASLPGSRICLRYPADGSEREVPLPERIRPPHPGDWPGRVLPIEWGRPSSFAPNEPMRLRIVSVRVERLQDITEEGARAEGVMPNWAGDDLTGWDPDEHGYLPPNVDDEGNVPGRDVYDTFTAREAYALWWDHLHKKRRGKGYDASWAGNPLVRVYRYEWAEAGK